MKKIAIFVSGAGEAAERIVKLFNEGNRVKTVMVVYDDSAAQIKDRIKDKEVELFHVPDSEWLSHSPELASLIKGKDVKLLVLDNFNQVLTDEIMETTDGEILRLSSPELAPREVVTALEKDFRTPAVETQEEEVQEPANPTPESEWAETLKIQFTPPKVPKEEVKEDQPVEVKEETWEVPNSNFQMPQGIPPMPEREYNREYFQDRNRHRRGEEPMPSTWLIWSILVTVFCCFIPGIVAIIFSSQVSSKYYMGDIEGAKRSSRLAEIWIIVSFVLGVMAATLYLPFVIIS